MTATSSEPRPGGLAQHELARYPWGKASQHNILRRRPPSALGEAESGARPGKPPALALRNRSE